MGRKTKRFKLARKRARLLETLNVEETKESAELIQEQREALVSTLEDKQAVQVEAKLEEVKVEPKVETAVEPAVEPAAEVEYGISLPEADELPEKATPKPKKKKAAPKKKKTTKKKTTSKK